ncbi:MAG TPA: nicotinamide-nucleotide amidohydrolase family protein, partial [Chitinophagaceae bacterium]|nr:nicotinamide-nucleotide amidohydrolase family protein [Chitinophagaceae bacterium]
LPALKTHFTMPFIIHQTLLTFGQGESMIADLLEPFEKKLPGHIKLAYLPNYGMVKLRLTGKGNNEEALQAELSSLFDELKEILKEWLVADEDITLQESIAQLCNKHKLFVGSAESCTGGYIAHLFTARPGSSSSFKGGIVTYANQAKENLLGVQHSTLVTHGAVSEETITEMVNGALEALKVDYVVASSGVLGPDGGTFMKPVGTVWLAVGNREKVQTAKIFLRFDRRRNIEIAANNALNMLRKFIIEQEEA